MARKINNRPNNLAILIFMMLAFAMPLPAQAWCLWDCESKTAKALDAAKESAALAVEAAESFKETAKQAFGPDPRFVMILGLNVVQLPDTAGSKSGLSAGSYELGIEYFNGRQSGWFSKVDVADFKTDQSNQVRQSLIVGYTRYFGLPINHQSLMLSVGTGASEVTDRATGEKQAFIPFYFDAFYPFWPAGRMVGPYLSVIHGELDHGRKGGGKQIGIRAKIML